MIPIGNVDADVIKQIENGQKGKEGWQGKENEMTEPKRRTRKVKAWIILDETPGLINDNGFLCTMVYSDERMAQGKAQHNHYDRAIPCTITYTIPKRKRT